MCTRYARAKHRYEIGTYLSCTATREPSQRHATIVGGVTITTPQHHCLSSCLFFCFFSELSSESFSLSTHHDIITLVLPSSPSGHGPPGAPPPPIVRSSFGSYKSWVCTDNRHIRDSVDDRHLNGNGQLLYLSNYLYLFFAADAA